MFAHRYAGRLARLSGLALSLFVLMFAAQTARAAETLKDEVHQTLNIAPNGTLRLTNINGSVVLRAGSTNTVEIRAVKSAKDAKALKNTNIEVKNVNGVITVETKGHGRMAQVDYEIVAPKSVNVEASTVNGAVKAEGFEGSVQASTINGAAAVEGDAQEVFLSAVNGAVTAKLGSRMSRVHMSTVNGAAKLHAPKAAEATIVASTQNGSIVNDLQLSEQRVAGGARLNHEGDAKVKIEVSTENGGVEIRRG